MSKPITLKQFVSSEIAALERFKRAWETWRAKDPELYPAKATVGDWLEQFDIFCKR